MPNQKSNMSDLFGEISKDYKIIEVPKIVISNAVRDGLKEKQLSLRKAAELIENTSYTQISRITRGENYNIDTLLKILSVLDIEIYIKNNEKLFDQVLKGYNTSESTKTAIAEIVRDGLKKKKLSLKKAAELVGNMSFTQVSRITNEGNYNISTLLRVLDILNMELQIKKKE